MPFDLAALKSPRAHQFAVLAIVFGLLAVVFGPSPDGKTMGIGEALVMGYSLGPSDIAWYLSGTVPMLGIILIAAGVAVLAYQKY